MISTDGTTCGCWLGRIARGAAVGLAAAGVWLSVTVGASAGKDDAFPFVFSNTEEIEGDSDLGGNKPTLSLEHVKPLEAAIKRYAGIVAKGGWQPIPSVKMENGSRGEAVVLLRKRLIAEGDLASGSGFDDDLFDGYVAEALRRFQWRYSLKQTGNLLDKDLTKNGTRTLTALNVPAASRLQQLRINLQRIKSQAKSMKSRYVLVNLPAQQIEAVENGKVVLKLNGVVGKPERASPLLSSSIHELNFNPVWTLPPTVVKEDLISTGKKMQAKKQNVLTKFKIDAFSNGKKLDPEKINWNSPAVLGYRYSQQPSKDNPLGFVKINFHNAHSVYMHDTPSKKLFEKTYRAASSGCIRVQNIHQLVAWLLKESPDWSVDRVLQMKESGERKDVKLKKPVPLHWVYVTAWADDNGTVHFRRDIYGKDRDQGVHKLASSY